MKTQYRNIAASSLWRHLKRDSEYRVLCEATLEPGALAAEGATLSIHTDDRVRPQRIVASVGEPPSNHRLICVASLQSAAPVRGGAKLVTYRCESDGSFWARPTGEFLDGRFEPVRSNLAS